MLKRILVPVVLLGVLAVGRVGWGQADGPSPEQQEMMQQMQDMRAKIMDNMQKQGIDPQQYFQDLRQRMQDGSFDMNDLQKEMVDKGLIDQKSVDDMQGSMQRLTLGGIKRQLGLSDDEWLVVLPKIQAVLVAQAGLGQTGGFGGGGGGFGGMNGFASGAAASEVSKAKKALHAAVKDPATTADVLNEKLAAYRAARAEAKTVLVGAQRDLVEVLTPRQEGLLVRAGLIE